MSESAWLVFGEDVFGGMVTIKQVDRGLKCNCVCPSCKAPLVARQGSKLVWHFAHAPGYEACASGVETSLHRMAKQIISKWHEIHLPEHIVSVEFKNQVGMSITESTSIPRSRFEISNYQLEADLDAFRPDVLLVNASGEQLSVEIYVTHSVNDQKRAKVEAVNMPMIEYDLSDFAQYGIDMDDLNDYLISITPKWIHHPSEAAARNQLLKDIRSEGLINVQQPDNLFKSVGLAQFEAGNTESTSASGHVAEGPSWPPLHRIPREIAKFMFMNMEILIRDNFALDSIVVWCCGGYENLRELALETLLDDAKAHGSRVYFGVGGSRFMLSGPDAELWAQEVGVRLGEPM